MNSLEVHLYFVFILILINPQSSLFYKKVTLACVFPHLNFQRDSRYFNTVNHVCL